MKAVVNADNLRKEYGIKADEKAVLCFFIEGCQPSIFMRDYVEEVVAEDTDCKLFLCDCTQNLNHKLAVDNGVEDVPTVIYFYSAGNHKIDFGWKNHAHIRKNLEIKENKECLA
jgi:hypothetical protein